MKLYLDTNILVHILNNEDDKIDNDTLAMLTDYSNVLYTCSVCAHELIYLRQTGKVTTSKDWGKKMDVVQRLGEFGIEITAITPAHLKTEEQLPLVGKHRDPNDRLIIAQAITDRTMLVSSDLQFAQYRKYGLKLHQNKR